MAEIERFRNTNRFSGTQGFVGGFPNFHQANYGFGIVYGSIMLPSSTVEWRNILRSDLVALDSRAVETVSAMIRAVNRWGIANGYDGGVPTFEQGGSGGDLSYGAMLLRPGVTQRQDVPRAQIGANSTREVPTMMRGANDYAAANGFVAGLPTFEEADYGAGVVFGIHLFPAGTAAGQDVHADVLQMQWNFTFDSGFSEGEIATVMERWAHAYMRLRECGTISDANKSKIVSAFRKNVNHTLSAPATANASAQINGATVNVNRTNFFELDVREQAQTLLHEMCHLAGFTHPDRRDCPPSMAPACDMPGDNGPYYGTVALQAELCIAGNQSDIVCAPTPAGMASERPPTPRVISVDYNPPGSDVDREHVRIRHYGDAPVQLQGWTLRDAANHTYIFPMFTLPPGSIVAVWTGRGSNDTNNLFWGRRKAVWTNRGDTAILADPMGVIRHTFVYQ